MTLQCPVVPDCQSVGYQEWFKVMLRADLVIQGKLGARRNRDKVLIPIAVPFHKIGHRLTFVSARQHTDSISTCNATRIPPCFTPASYIDVDRHLSYSTLLRWAEPESHTASIPDSRPQLMQALEKQRIVHVVMQGRIGTV